MLLRNPGGRNSKAGGGTGRTGAGLGLCRRLPGSIVTVTVTVPRCEEGPVPPEWTPADSLADAPVSP